MRSRLYVYTKPNIISVRFSDDEMEFIQGVMDATGMKPSDVLRKAFAVLMDQLEQAEDARQYGTGCAAENAGNAACAA